MAMTNQPGGPGRLRSQAQSDPLAPRYLDFPYSVSSRQVPATTTSEDHLRDLIVQTLFTNPGERVNLPEFGVGILRFVFEPNGDALQATVQFLIASNLQRWLGNLIDVDSVSVSSELGAEEQVNIEVFYTLRVTQQRQRVIVQV